MESFNKKSELIYKPNSVLCGHSSGLDLTVEFMRSTRPSRPPDPPDPDLSGGSGRDINAGYISAGSGIIGAA